MDALYLPDGDGFVGTLLSQGGWHPEHQHGGPVQGLLTRCLERVPTLVPMQLCRLTFDMVRPVPIGPRLDISTEIRREGKKIQLVEAVLRVDGVEHTRASALRLRTDDVTAGPVPPSTIVDAPLPPPEAFPPVYRDLPHAPGFLRGLDMIRFPRPGGAEGEFGYWIHLTSPLVAGEATSAMSRLAVAGDFTNGIGILVDQTQFSTINADVNVHVVREPVDEHVAVVGDTRQRLDVGIGVSVAELHDRLGVCAVASTCQLLQLR